MDPTREAGSNAPQPEIGLLGTFVSPEAERLYREASLADDKRRMSWVVPVLLLTNVIYVFNDWRQYGGTGRFLVAAGLRAILFPLLFGEWILLKRVPKPRLLDLGLMLILFQSAILELSVTAQRPVHFTAYLPLETLMVFAIYAAIPASVILQAAAALFLSVGSVAVFAFTKQPEDGSTLLSLICAYALAHTVGILTSRELNSYRRKQYRALLHEAALRERLEGSEARLLETQRVARLGGWEFDVGTGIVTWSEEVFRLFGRDPGQRPPNFEELLTLIDPADGAQLQAHVEAAIRNGTPYSMINRLDLPGAPRRYLMGHGQPMSGEDGNVIRLVGTVQDVTEQVEIEERLRQAKDAAEAGARAKAEFLAMMSHELRTPMNGVLGMAGLLAETPLTDEQRDYLETIQLSGRSLLDIINDLLDFSKIEAGRMQLEWLEFPLQGVLEEAMQVVGGVAREKGLTLELRVSDGTPENLVSDPVRLRQVLLNLLSNAVKFTAKGGVRIEVRPEIGEGGESVVRITVIDTGIGIPEAARNSLFHSFTQADSSTTRKYGGTGLGLAICKRLVELLRGRIGFSSEPGHGSAFWLLLPVHAAASRRTA